MDPRGRRMVPLRAAAKATKSQTRQANLRLALQVVMAAGQISRADVARQTGLTRATVSALVAELIDDDLLHEAGVGESAGGKKPILLEINGAARQVVAIDVSADPIQGALVGLDGTRVATRQAPAAGLGGEEAVDAIAELAGALADLATAPLLGVGVGTPGVVDEHGTVIEAANLGWHGLPLATILTDRLDLPVHIANDAHVSAIDEYGRRDDVDSLVVVRVGHGIGAGIVLDGRPYTGDRHAAGEIGHLRVIPDGPPCRCGGRGCLEGVASLPAILAAAGDPDADPATLAETEAGALAIAAEHLGHALASMVAVLDVHHVLIGGPVEAFGLPFLEAVGSALRSRVLPAIAETLVVEHSSAGEHAVLAGAWALVVAEELGVVRR